MKTSYGTISPETEIIAAAAANDTFTIITYLEGMLPGELARLKAQCWTVINLIEERLEEAKTR